MPFMRSAIVGILTGVVLLITSCDKKESRLPAGSEYIVAGVTDSNMNFTAFTPEQPLINGNLALDLTGDGKGDIMISETNVLTGLPFGAYYNGSFNGGGGASKLVMVGRLNYEYGIRFGTRPLASGARIDAGTGWTDQGYNSLVLDYRLDGVHNIWNDEGQYLAVCTAINGKTRYGWVGIQIRNGELVVVRDFAIAKKGH